MASAPLASVRGTWLPVLISFYSLNFVSRFPIGCLLTLDCVWYVMAHAQKPDFVFRRNGRVHLNRRGRQFSRLLAAAVCASAVVMLDTPCSEVVWRVLATHSIRRFTLHFPSCASPCAITFQLDSNAGYNMFQGSVKSTGYPLHSPVSSSLPLLCVTMCHHISTGLYYFLIGPLKLKTLDPVSSLATTDLTLATNDLTFLLNFSTPVYKMWIIQEPKKGSIMK
jgi:hypothetical protein